MHHNGIIITTVSPSGQNLSQNIPESGNAFDFLLVSESGAYQVTLQRPRAQLRPDDRPHTATAKIYIQFSKILEHIAVGLHCAENLEHASLVSGIPSGVVWIDEFEGVGHGIIWRYLKVTPKIRVRKIQFGKKSISTR